MAFIDSDAYIGVLITGVRDVDRYVLERYGALIYKQDGTPVFRAGQRLAVQVDRLFERLCRPDGSLCCVAEFDGQSLVERQVVIELDFSDFRIVV